MNLLYSLVNQADSAFESANWNDDFSKAYYDRYVTDIKMRLHHTAEDVDELEKEIRKIMTLLDDTI